MRVALWAALGALFVVGGIDPAIGHEWHDVTGQYSREGDFADLRDGRVDVRLTDGRTAHVALGKLCEADQTYVNEMMAARGGDAVALTGDATQNDGAAETLPAPRLPVHTVAMQIAGPDQAPAQAQDSAADEANAETYKWPHKYVYFTCSGTFHLLDFGRRNGFGTAHYELCDHVHSCCCEHCEWWLAKLTKINTTPYYFIYEASFGDPDTDYWAFARWPDCGCCKYSVWRHSKSCGWIRFGCGDRVTPK